MDFSELKESLANNDRIVAELKLIGTVKYEDSEVYFSLSQMCGSDWTKVPPEIVSEVNAIGERSCEGHSHPIVELRLQEPKNEEALFYFELVRKSNQPLMNRMIDGGKETICMGGWQVECDRREINGRIILSNCRNLNVRCEFGQPDPNRPPR